MINFVNIVFSSDDNYAQHTAVAMASILLNTSNPAKIRFFIIDDGITDDKKSKIKGTAESLQSTVEFITVKNKQLMQGFVSGEISRACYFRIDIPNILPAEVTKVIYLDCDLLLYDDIQILWNTDIGDYPLAAVCDYGIMASKRLRRQKAKCIGLPYKADYFNSGVLIMNLDAWRKADYSSKVIEIVQNNKFPNHDQDALNKVFMNNWYVLPLRWNVIPPVFNLFMKILKSELLRKNAVEAKKNPAIFHYAGGYKAWEYKLYQGFNDQYYKYLSYTDFKDAVMPQLDKRRKNRSIKRQLIRLKIADVLAKIF